MADRTPEERAAIWEKFSPIYQRLGLITTRQNGLLAHYTSVATIEQILKNNAIWLSNPLYMNDLQELRGGLAVALQKFPEVALVAGRTVARAQILTTAFNFFVAHFDSETSLDTYIFCLCNHEPGDTDGLLSMWREYGARGNGAALVFNLEKVNFNVTSPLLIAKVVYADDRQREDNLVAHLDAWASITQALDLPPDRLSLAAHAAFMFTRLVALTTKHRGFSEEHEIRIIYTPDHDPRGYLKPCLDYHVGPRGVEPKLKYRFGESYPPADDKEPKEPLRAGSLTNLLEFILLGPTVSSLHAKKAFIRMLERNNLTAFEDRVFTSSIPLRPM